MTRIAGVADLHRQRRRFPPVMSGRKRCRTCGLELDVTAFLVNDHYRDGRESQCGMCSRATSRAANRRATKRWYAGHRTEKLVVGNAWRRRNRLALLTARNERRFGGNYLLVLRRDLARCVDCHTTKALVIHHVDGRSYHNSDDPNNAPENLVTLCRSCHSKRHVVELGRPHERVPGQSRRHVA